MDFHSVPGLDIQGESLVTGMDKKNDSEKNSPNSTLPTSCKQEQVELPVKIEPELVTVDVKEEGHLERAGVSADKNEDTYLSQSKEDLVVLLRKQDDDIRALREEVRKQCLKISHQANIIHNSKVLAEKSSPIFEAFEKCSPFFKEMQKSMRDLDER